MRSSNRQEKNTPSCAMASAAAAVRSDQLHTTLRKRKMRMEERRIRATKKERKGEVEI